MNVFSAATDVALSIPLTDNAGNIIEIDTISYTVSNGDGMELIALTSLADFGTGSETADIVIPAEFNTLTEAKTSDLRVVTLFCTIGTNTLTLDGAYAVSVADLLVAGANSFMTYARAEFTALSMSNLTGWNTADQQARTAALIEARDHIVQLSFTQLNSNQPWGQDSLNFIPEGTYRTGYVGADMFTFNGNLDYITPDQFKGMPPKFIMALQKAQLAEANAILGGDPTEAKRLEGITMDQVGESRQAYRLGKPLQLPICRRAMSYLSLYVSFSKRIGR